MLLTINDMHVKAFSLFLYLTVHLSLNINFVEKCFDGSSLHARKDGIQVSLKSNWDMTLVTVEVIVMS